MFGQGVQLLWMMNPIRQTSPAVPHGRKTFQSSSQILLFRGVTRPVGWNERFPRGCTPGSNARSFKWVDDIVVRTCGKRSTDITVVTAHGRVVLLVVWVVWITAAVFGEVQEVLGMITLGMVVNPTRRSRLAMSILTARYAGLFAMS